MSTTALRNALAELRRNLALPDGPVARAQPDLIPTFRTAAIKSFEYAYEMSIKLLRRALEAKAATPQDIDAMDFKVMLRAAAEAGLLDEPLAWVMFRDKRNITSHTYDAAKAMDVLAALPGSLCRRSACLSA